MVSINLVSNNIKPVIGFILLMLTNGIILFGISKYFLLLSKNQNVKFNVVFSGLDNIESATIIHLRQLFYIFFWSIFFIPGLITNFSYTLSYYILVDNPEFSGREAFKESKRLMDGNKKIYFDLILPYLGWILFSFIAVSALYILIEVIGYQNYMYNSFAKTILYYSPILLITFYVMPSFLVTTAYFYQYLISNNQNKEFE